MTNEFGIISKPNGARFRVLWKGADDLQDVVEVDVHNGLYCPFCAGQPVAIDKGEGDYHYGLNHRCMVCGEDFYLC